MGLVKDDAIFRRIKEHRQFVMNKGYRVVATLLVGSQNYDLDTKHSDIDTIAIVIPSFKDFVLKINKPVSTTLILENNEHCDVKDIRLFFELLLRSNIKMSETLFTKYHIIDPDYQKYFEVLFDHAEDIVNYNYKRLLDAISGICKQKLKALDYPSPATVKAINQYGYDPKQLHHLYRLHEFVRRFVVGGESYGSCLKSKSREFFTNIKFNPQYTVHEAKEVAMFLVSGINETIEASPRWQCGERHEETKEFVNKLLYDVLLYSVTEEVAMINPKKEEE